MDRLKFWKWFKKSKKIDTMCSTQLPESAPKNCIPDNMVLSKKTPFIKNQGLAGTCWIQAGLEHLRANHGLPKDEIYSVAWVLMHAKIDRFEALMDQIYFYKKSCSEVLMYINAATEDGGSMDHFNSIIKRHGLAVVTVVNEPFDAKLTKCMNDAIRKLCVNAVTKTIPLEDALEYHRQIVHRCLWHNVHNEKIVRPENHSYVNICYDPRLEATMYAKYVQSPKSIHICSRQFEPRTSLYTVPRRTMKKIIKDCINNHKEPVFAAVCWNLIKEEMPAGKGIDIAGKYASYVNVPRKAFECSMKNTMLTGFGLPNSNAINHAISIVGYDETTSNLLIKNSHGDKDGCKGFYEFNDLNQEKIMQISVPTNHIEN